MIVVPYTLIGPRKLPGFYHVYAEVILEFFLFLFWLSSFASMANYVSTFEWSKNLTLTSVNGFNNPAVESALDEAFNAIYHNIRNAMNCFKAVTVFGALEL